MGNRKVKALYSVSETADSAHRYSYNQLSKTKFRDISKRLFEFLCEAPLRRALCWSMIFGDYEDVFMDSFHDYPEIGFVLDTARLDITRRAFYGFDPYHFLDRMASGYMWSITATYFMMRTSSRITCLSCRSMIMM